MFGIDIEEITLSKIVLLTHTTSICILIPIKLYCYKIKSTLITSYKHQIKMVLKMTTTSHNIKYHSHNCHALPTLH